MRIEELIKKLQDDLKNLQLLKDVLLGVDGFPLKRLNELESARNWVANNENNIKRKIDLLKKIENLINIRIKWLNRILYTIASLNLLFLLWSTPVQRSLLSIISMIAVFALAVCRANPIFRWRPILTAIILPFSALTVLYLVPYSRFLIDKYASAITSLGVIYSVILIVLGNKIDNSQQWH